ncbi:DNA cytosine methyltransferase [Zavarzinella formosa]|uniref:DNA cytosine methyltransferase n=1 Tax=Zavarzinella formosa TaxID=360055 RepID=UPI0002F7B13C|nr:DNA cytosine methyltransferase [Zavarzinella formosa]
MSKPLIFGSVCSGIEAASVAWHPLGWQAAFYSEIDPFPRAVLQHHYPSTPLHGDFTTIRKDEYAAIDLLVGGTPCQAFSVAGLRKGFADERGNLTLEFVRLAQRLRPRWLVWENVPGVLSSYSDSMPPGDLEAGQEWEATEESAFGCFLAGLAECGYGFAYRVLDAQHFGVPQRRRRVFVVGYLGDWRPPAAVLFERESLLGDITPRRAKGEKPTVCPTLRAGGNRTGGDRPPGTDVDTADSLIATALTARYQKGADSECTTTFVTHALRGEGFDASEDGTGRGTPLVPVTPFTLAIRGRGDDHQLEYRQDGIANAILTPNGGRAGIGAGAVAFAQNTRDELRYIGGDGQIVGALAAETGMKQQSYIQQLMSVRRLTPRECERLQGFPDDYTLVPNRGKPAADGPRYKSLGNSMAVPCMRFIGERVQQVENLLAI